jgi:hypothetical protein
MQCGRNSTTEKSENWLSSQDKQGHLRLSNSDDFVRIELEAGLERNIPVIPVLVSGADISKSTPYDHNTCKISM